MPARRARATADCASGSVDDRFQVGQAVAPFLVAAAGDGTAAAGVAGSLTLARRLAGTLSLSRVLASGLALTLSLAFAWSFSLALSGLLPIPRGLTGFVSLPRGLALTLPLTFAGSFPFALARLLTVPRSLAGFVALAGSFAFTLSGLLALARTFGLACGLARLLPFTGCLTFARWLTGGGGFSGFGSGLFREAVEFVAGVAQGLRFVAENAFRRGFDFAGEFGDSLGGLFGGLVVPGLADFFKRLGNAVLVRLPERFAEILGD